MVAKYLPKFTKRFMMYGLVFMCHCRLPTYRSAYICTTTGGQDGPNSCDSKDSGCFGEPASWKIYRRNIAKAVESYVDCPSTNCSCYQHVVNDDLKPWKDSGITKEMISAALPYGVHYRIVNHRLFRQPDCMFLFRCKGVEHFILSVIEELDDTEFLLNTRDWPQIHRLGPRIPVLSFSKTSEYMDIMYPAWSFWEGGPAISLYPTGIGRWDLLRESLKRKGQEYYWSRKLSKGFFRGSRTSAERDPLVLLSREDPELVDAQYTKNQAWKSDADTLGAPPASEVSFEDHCRYKFLFNFRGVAASFRLKHLFLCKSLVFHVGDEWREFFYAALLPWVHYIPVSPDLSDVRDLLSFAKSNEAEVKWIAKRGYDFIWNHLKMEDVQCYWRSLLNDYRQLLRFKVNLGVTDDLIEIL